MTEEPKNPHAQALGRMGRGIKKTITPALIRRNKRAAKFPRPSRQHELAAERKKVQALIVALKRMQGAAMDELPAEVQRIGDEALAKTK